MKFRHFSSWLRSLGPAGLVALCVLAIAPHAIAQPTSEIFDIFRFPALSVDPDQAKMLAFAFMFQMQMFLGISNNAETGTGGGLAALRYLAIMAALIGATLVIFFPKYQKAPILISWSLLVLIVIFVPTASRLIFSPITVPDPGTMDRLNAPPNIHNGTPCNNSNQAALGCGFTPQLAAIHLGTTLQMIASDIFRSDQWTGLITRLTGDAFLTTQETFNLSESWYKLNREWVKNCDKIVPNLISLLPNAQVNADNQLAQANKPFLTTFGQVWHDIAKLYDGNTLTMPPPAIVFPETLAQATQLGWNSTEREQYLAGLLQLHNSIAPEFNTSSKPVVQISFEEASSNGAISAKQALDNLSTKMFFQYEYGWRDKWFNTPTYPTGIVFARMSDLKPAIIARQCFTSRTAALTPKTGQRYQGLNQETCAVTVSGFMAAIRFFNQQIEKQNDFKGVSEPWLSLSRNFASYSKMPVAYGLIKQTDAATASNPQGVTRGNREMEVTSGPTCLSMGREIITQSLGTISNKGPAARQGSPLFDKLYDMIVNGTNLPTVKDNQRLPQLTWSDITSLPSTETQQQRPIAARLINSMVFRMNEAIRQSGSNEPDDIREAMLRSLMALNAVVTAQVQGINEKNAQAANEDGSTVNLDLVGIDPVATIGGEASFQIGKALVSILALFTGPVAVAYLSFLVILIDITLLTLITITPILFMLGLLIPSNAAGVLSISIISVFVLKFVPITIILLNMIGGMIYDLMPASMGTGASFSQSLLIIAMAGMYTSVVALTFFLIFKLGDPQAVLGRLTALDGAAKEMAERGRNAALIAFTAAASAIGGGIMAAASRSGKKPTKPEDPQPQTDEGKAAQQQSKVDDITTTDPVVDALAGAASEASATNPIGNINDKIALQNKILGMNKELSPYDVADPLKTLKDTGEATLPGIDGSSIKLELGQNGEVFATSSSANPVNAALLGNTATTKNPVTDALANTTSTKTSTPDSILPTDSPNAADAATANAANAATTAAASLASGAAAGTQSSPAGNAQSSESNTATQSTQALRKQLEKQAGELDEIKIYKDGTPSSETVAPEALIMANDQLAANKRDAESQAALERFSKDPGLLKTVLSGIYGGFMGAIGGPGSIPILGPILKESLNEYYQAEQRARGVALAGSVSAYLRKRGDAQRAAFAEKEIAPLLAGENYTNKMSVGGYDAQYQIARWAANDAIARSRSQFEAMEAHRQDTNRQDLVYTAKELAGLGRAEAANRVQSLFQEKSIIQGDGFDVIAPKFGANGVVIGGEKVKAKYSQRVFNQWAANNAAKSFIGAFEANQIANFGIVEKRFVRQGDWSITADMASNSKAAAAFARLDPGTDYLVGGEHKMRLGKAGFYQMRGEVEELQKLRITQDAEVERYVRLNQSKFTAQNITSFADQKKAAMSELKNLDKNLLPLEAFMEEGFNRARLNFRRRAQTSVAATLEETANMNQTVKNANSAAIVNNFKKAVGKQTKKVRLGMNGLMNEVKFDVPSKELLDIVEDVFEGDTTLINIVGQIVADVGQSKEEFQNSLQIITNKKHPRYMEASLLMGENFMDAVIQRLNSVRSDAADKLRIRTSNMPKKDGNLYLRTSQLDKKLDSVLEDGEITNRQT